MHTKSSTSKAEEHPILGAAYGPELVSKLLLTGTHLRKRAVATLSYSPASTLHPQVIYAIAFSAGLNGVEVD